MSWQTARGYAWARAMRLLGERPVVTLAAIVIAAVALALPIGTFMIAQALPAQALPVAEVSVFVATGTNAADLKALAGKVSGLDGVASVKTVSRAEAWADLQKRAKDLQPLPEARFNTLPDILVVRFVPGAPVAAVEAAASGWAKLPRVESVQAELGWYRRLVSATRIGVATLQVAAVVGLVLLVALVLGAVRIAVASDVDELRVLDQFGADRDFVRRPFAYAGATVLGLAAAGSVGLTALASRAAAPALQELAQTFGLQTTVALPPWPLIAAFLAAAVLMGAVAAHTFAGRALARVELWRTH